MYVAAGFEDQGGSQLTVNALTRYPEETKKKRLTGDFDGAVILLAHRLL